MKTDDPKKQKMWSSATLIQVNAFFIAFMVAFFGIYVFTKTALNTENQLWPIIQQIEIQVQQKFK